MTITKSNPTFNWEAIDGVATYNFNLSYWDGTNNYWLRLSALYSSKLAGPQYSLQVAEDDKEKWSSSNNYFIKQLYRHENLY